MAPIIFPPAWISYKGGNSREQELPDLSKRLIQKKQSEVANQSFSELFETTALISGEEKRDILKIFLSCFPCCIKPKN